MSLYATSRNVALGGKLSNIAEFLNGIKDLRELLLSSPSSLTTDAEKIIIFVEIAKSTLQRNGVVLRTFSSCPTMLRQYKAAYFDILLQLQSFTYNKSFESKDLEVRLRRLLFPLSTQLKVRSEGSPEAPPSVYNNCTLEQPTQKKEHKATVEPPSLSPPSYSSSQGIVPSSHQHTSKLWRRHVIPPVIPPDVMLPPPQHIRPMVRTRSASFLPIEHQRLQSPHGLARIRPTIEMHLTKSLAVMRRRASRDTVHFKHRNPEPVLLPKHYPHVYPHIARTAILRSTSSQPEDTKPDKDTDEDEDEEDENESSDEDMDEDCDMDDISPKAEKPKRLVIPAYAPLRHTFGIFCTGKGRGAFNNSIQRQRQIYHTLTSLVNVHQTQ